jgi:hypothetical protein
MTNFTGVILSQLRVKNSEKFLKLLVLGKHKTRSNFMIHNSI